MDQQDAFKAAQARGYSKGYAAGKRAKAKAVASDRRAKAQLAFRQRAFLAVLPWVFEQNTWGRKKGEQHAPYKTIEERVGFAWSIAEESVEKGVSLGVV